MKGESYERRFLFDHGNFQGDWRSIGTKYPKKGGTVLGVARSRSAVLKSTKYHHLTLDLAEASRLGQIMEKVDEVVDNHRFDFVCLVNNASALEPLGAIEKCPASEIDTHVRISMIAPMILTSLFIRKFSDGRMRKK
jgi:benzil reductase ((S)-benzoin forming)